MISTWIPQKCYQHKITNMILEEYAHVVPRRGMACALSRQRLGSTVIPLSEMIDVVVREVTRSMGIPKRLMNGK